MAQTFLNVEQVDELVAMYRGGKTMRQVANHFSVHRTTVSVHLKRQSVSVRRGKLIAAEVAEIGDLYDEGFTLVEIGMRFGVGQDTVRRAVIAAGGTIRRPGRRAGEVVISVLHV